jgi:hypothetical protein
MHVANNFSMAAWATQGDARRRLNSPASLARQAELGPSDRGYRAADVEARKEYDPGRASSSSKTREGQATARPKPRVQRLNSRRHCHNGSGHPDRRICDDRGSTSCAPTRWKGIRAAFSVPLLSTVLTNMSQMRHTSPASGRFQVLVTSSIGPGPTHTCRRDRRG